MAVYIIWYETVLCLTCLLLFLVELNAAVNGISHFANISDETENNAAFGNKSRSGLANITSNELKQEPPAINTTTIKMLLATNVSQTPSTEDVLIYYESGKANTTNELSTVSPLSIDKSTTHPIPSLTSTHVSNYTTISPSHAAGIHHFNMKIIDYILIPVGCLLAIVITFLLVRHVQKLRRKRRLERELFHQYSYPNSEADDLEEQNIGEIESVINTQFVAFSDQLDKTLYEDTSEVNLAFDETSKLVVNEAAPDSPGDASTSFIS